MGAEDKANKHEAIINERMKFLQGEYKTYETLLRHAAVLMFGAEILEFENKELESLCKDTPEFRVFKLVAEALRTGEYGNLIAEQTAFSEKQISAAFLQGSAAYGARRGKKTASNPRPVKNHDGITLDSVISKLYKNYPTSTPREIWVHFKSELEDWSDDSVKEVIKAKGSRDGDAYHYELDGEKNSITFGAFRKKKRQIAKLPAN